MNNNSQPFVSIVTPVYNGEPYLSECIESVLAQTYNNWDYTIINNCSTDRTLDIARKYADRDNRIRVHNNNKFVGVIQNHNIAFRQIHPESKYCKFVLADDWIFPDCITKMVEVAEKHPSVGIVCSYSLGGQEVIWDGLPYPSVFMMGREVCRATLLQEIPYVFGTPTSQLFVTNVVRNNINVYNESNLHADQEICFSILRYYDFGFVHQVLSYTRKDNESITSFTNRMDSYVLGSLIPVIKYGTYYLSEEELDSVFSTRMKRYYRLLAKRCLQLKEKGYWEYHNNILKEYGLEINKYRLFKNVIFEITEKLANPLNGIKGVVEWWPSAFSRKFLDRR